MKYGNLKSEIDNNPVIPTSKTITNNINTIPSEDVMLSATVMLNDSQIKMLGIGGTEVEIIPAPGENKIIVFFGAIAVLDESAGVYTGITDSALIFFVGGVPVSGLQKFPDSANISTFYFSPVSLQGAGVPVIGNYAGQIYATPISGLAAYTNRPLTLTDWWAAGEYSDGNVNNTMQVTVFYAIADVS